MKKLLIVAFIALVLSACDYTMLPGKHVVHKYLTDLSFIPVPKGGDVPLYVFETYEYTGSISWKPNNGSVVKSFDEGITYTAEILLIPKEDYTFHGFSQNFIHRYASSVSQTISTYYALVSVDFPRILFTDAEFTSLTGERFKTFCMTPDKYQIASNPYNAAFSFSRTDSYQSQGAGTVGETQTWDFSLDNVDVMEFLDLSNTARFRLIHTRITSYSGGGGTETTTSYSTLFRLSQIFPQNFSFLFAYNTEESDFFSSNSYILPADGYAADRNYFEYNKAFFPSITVSKSLLNSLFVTSFIFSENSGVFNAVEPIFTYRQVSRGFYVYKSISISFEPVIEIVGWQGGALIDHFVMDNDTNTLTAYLKEYDEKITGELFFINIIAENGKVHRKSVAIGN